MLDDSDPTQAQLLDSSWLLSLYGQATSNNGTYKERRKVSVPITYLIPEVILSNLHAAFPEMSNLSLALDFSSALWRTNVLCLVPLNLP